MKHLLRTILLLGVLCLAGCKEEEPQSVAFMAETLNVGNKQEILELGIHANCQWSITTNPRFIEITENTGHGDAVIFLTVYPNYQYEDLTHEIIISSEDGTSDDILTIKQDSKKGLIAGHVDMISEEGGVFELSVNTNEGNISIETPDWVTLTSSRALAEQTYTFSAKPNKTGAVRKGVIKLKGAETEDKVGIEQDSYSPDSVWASLPSFAAGGSNIVCKLHYTPEYADLSKAETNVKLCLGSKIINDELHMSIRMPGNIHTIYEEDLFFYVNGKQVGHQIVTIVKPGISVSSSRYIYFPGENFHVSSLTEPYGKIEISNPEVISRLEDGRFKALKNGSCTITGTNLADGSTDSKTFTVHDVALTAELYGISNPYDDIWEVTFHATARGNSITQYNMFVTLNGDSEQLAVKQGKLKEGTYSVDYVGKIKVTASDSDSLHESLKGTRFHFIGMVDNRETSADILIL